MIELTNINRIRQNILNITKDLSDAQLNKIPAGFNNNIIWNIAHLSAVLQRICYVRSGLAGHIEVAFSEEFKNGTRPTRDITAIEIKTIRDLLMTSIEQLEIDVASSLFVNYEAWNTSIGIEINSLSNAIAFLPYHEGLHTGAILAIKKLV